MNTEVMLPGSIDINHQLKKYMSQLDVHEINSAGQWESRIYFLLDYVKHGRRNLPIGRRELNGQDKCQIAMSVEKIRAV